VGLAQEAVREALELEPDVERAVVGGVEHALRHRERERRVAGQLVDQRADGGVEPVAGTTRVTSPSASASSACIRRPRMTMSFARPRPTSRASRCVPPEPGSSRSSPREAELDVVRGEAEVAGERELMPTPNT
jgi:hypothetical protein